MRTAYRQIDDGDPIRQAYIYQTVLRLWHWLDAGVVVALCFTGYFIGTPLPSYTGDPSEVYVMGWVRAIHLSGGYLFAVLWMLRMWWAVVGNIYARQLFVPPIWRKSWVEGLMYQLAWNLFVVGRARRYVGLNPLAHVAMLVLFVAPSVLLVITGFGMLAEVAGHDSWQYHLFGWMRITENTLDLHTIHRLSMWVVILFIIAHVYSAVREDILSRQTMVSTMLSGFRLFKE
ncbi:MAG: Ni/Fe-hydrogenase, b-type cytochrome subunit [Actinomycetota bacterium]